MGCRHQNPLAAHCTVAELAVVATAVVEQVDAALQAVEAVPTHLAEVAAVGPYLDLERHLEHAHQAFALRR